MTNEIGYLGPRGTFTKMAVDAAFIGAGKIAYETIPACIDAVRDGEIAVGVVPLENAIEGTVQITVDYLIHQARLPVVAEIVVPIEQHLMTQGDFFEDLQEITDVYSHSHAIAQCHQYLHKYMPHAKIHYTSSTGRAAEFVSGTDKKIAAIGNKLAAEEYGLTIIKENIHDFANNHTRFAVLTRDGTEVKINQGPVSEKTSLFVTLPQDYAGALHQVLSAFAWRKMNLSKIESRPMKTGLGNYFFIIDVDQPYDDILFPGVKAELEQLGCNLTVLGSYPVYHIPV